MNALFLAITQPHPLTNPIQRRSQEWWRYFYLLTAPLAPILLTSDYIGVESVLTNKQIVLVFILGQLTMPCSSMVSRWNMVSDYLDWLPRSLPHRYPSRTKFCGSHLFVGPICGYLGAEESFLHLYTLCTPLFALVPTHCQSAHRPVAHLHCLADHSP